MVVELEAPAGTGRIDALLENTVKGPVPLVIVTVAGTPEKIVAAAGSTCRTTVPGLLYGLFGAPPPPPQAASESMPTSARRVTKGRSEAVTRGSTMVGFLMMMS
jgi:hypothetical protein